MVSNLDCLREKKKGKKKTTFYNCSPKKVRNFECLFYNVIVTIMASSFDV